MFTTLIDTDYTLMINDCRTRNWCNRFSSISLLLLPVRLGLLFCGVCASRMGHLISNVACEPRANAVIMQMNGLETQASFNLFELYQPI
jgi:hypothetical protein